jgi:6,7-dimethyl-8-ribityllumazine synthase
VVVVVARPHDAVDERLLEGARFALTEAGVDGGDVTVVEVPGISQIPIAVQYAAESARFDAVVCLCSLRETELPLPHVDITLSAVMHTLQIVTSQTGVPFTLGVLTADAVEPQTAGPVEGSASKGYDAAKAALEMVAVIRRLRST